MDNSDNQRDNDILETNEEQEVDSKQVEEQQAMEKILDDYSKKRKQNNFLTVGSLVALAIALGLFFRLTNINPSYFLSDVVGGDNYVNITFNTADKPSYEEVNYDLTTGKYTTQGVAQVILPSMVSILVYQEDIPYTPYSQGSGIILTDNGYIATNAHVIEAEEGVVAELVVELNDGSRYVADIIGSDSETDLAVIKINMTGLTPAQLGKSENLSVGEEVVTAGSPAGLNGSITKGIVSGLDRMIKTDAQNREMNCVQIDAAINPGNSGGALVNMYGQVVGINTSKYTSEKYDGIGFAISIDAAMPIIESLIANGYVTDRFKIGISFFEVDEVVAEIDGIVAGLHIQTIDETCDIANSGLQLFDVITHANGVPVFSKTDLLTVLEDSKPGDSVDISVSRVDESGNVTQHDFTFKLMEDTSSQIESEED